MLGMPDVFDSDKLIFVSFEPGAGGHRLARIICSLPDVYWYSHPDNGKHPWNIHFNHTNIYQRHVSKRHFDRLTPYGMIPPTWDYVYRYEPNQDIYWTKFEQQFYKVNGYSILNTHRLVWCTHLLPKEIYHIFPNAKIINIITEPETTTLRFMETTAKFYGFTRPRFLNWENTKYGQYLESISLKIGSDFRIRDIWAMDNFNKGYDSSMAKRYYKETLHTIEENTLNRVLYSSPTALDFWYKDYKALKEFLYV